MVGLTTLTWRQTAVDGFDGMDREQLAQMIGALPEAQKLVATLLWYEGLSLDEAAHALGVSAEEAAELHEKAVATIRKELRLPEPSRTLAGWSRVEVDAECARQWRAYDKDLTEHYKRYFGEHDDLRGEQEHSARDLAAALPPSWGALGDLVAGGEWHRWHLSGKSSQTLAVGLLGQSARLDPTLSWLWDALSPLPPAGDHSPQIDFEQTLTADVLGEQPRQTAVDVLVDDPSALICIEIKRAEQGLGACSCGADGGNPLKGRCATRIEGREAYWAAAADLLGLPAREPPGPCPISLPYQAVRNAAAARALAKPGQLAVFGLVYDEQNPYFGGSGAWPGWPKILAEAFAANADPQRFRFASISWQQLLPLMELEDETRACAREKHRLGGEDRRHRA